MEAVKIHSYICTYVGIANYMKQSSHVTLHAHEQCNLEWEYLTLKHVYESLQALLVSKPWKNLGLYITIYNNWYSGCGAMLFRLVLYHYWNISITDYSRTMVI